MPLITEQISNLINGVSQQPPNLRLASQCEVQENGLVTTAEGLKKRPPLEHVGKLNNKTDTDAKVHFIDRSDGEQYIVTVSSNQFDEAFSSDFTKGELEIFHLDTVADPFADSFDASFGSSEYYRGHTGGTPDYLIVNDARDTLRAFTVADFTFFLNKNKVTAKSSVRGSERAPEGIVFLKQASNATTFKVFLDGATVGSITNSNDATTLIDNVFTAMNDEVGFTCTKFGSSNVHVTKSDGTDFTLHVEAPEANMIAVKDTVTDFTDLPARTKDGFTVKVAGDPGSSSDDYWLKHENQADEDVGVWLETVEPNLENTIDPATMPIKLVRTDDIWDDAFDDTFGASHFALTDIVWTPRAAGDEETAPDPSFIGHAIKDLFFHKNRLGVLASENIVLSELGEHFNYYTTTATDLLDTDVIDLAAPTNDVHLLKNALAFNEDLLIFSDDGQFKLTEFAAGGLTPTNAKLALLTQYEHDANIQPQLSGRKIYFADENDGFSVVREFGIVEDLQEETAEDITSHIPSYIKGSGYKIVTHDDFLFVLSDENQNEIFVYTYLFQQGEKKLSSWGKWKFKEEEKVIDMKIIDHVAHFVIVRPDGTYHDKMSLQDANLVGLTESSTQLPFKVHLDRLVEVTGEYASSTDTTTWTLPYPDDNGSTFRVVLGPAWTAREGSLVQGVTQTSSTTLMATGDQTAGSVFIGKEYQFLYTFTEPTIKTETQGRLTSLAGGVLKIRKWNVEYFKSGFFQLRVTAPGREAFTHTFTGRILGSELNKIGSIPLETGSFKKLILADAKKLEISLISNSYLPCAFTGGDWEGLYVVRTVSRR